MVSIQEETGRSDYRVIPEEELNNCETITAGISVLYRLRENGENRTVRSGDSFTITFPEYMKGIRPDENGPICIYGDNQPFDGINCEWK